MDAEKKETKLLKQRIEVLEKENIALKKSLYDLSVRFNMLGHRAVPFTIDSLDANGDLPPMESLLEPSGSAGFNHHDSLSVASSSSASSSSHTSSAASAPTADAPASSVGLGVSGGGLGSPGSVAAAAAAAAANLPSGGGGNGGGGSGAAHVDVAAAASGSASSTTALSNVPTLTPAAPSASVQATPAPSPANQVPPPAAATASSEPKKAKDPSRHGFSLKAELKGHTGAVYTVEFSQCGRFLASGSFDKSVRIWETNGVGSTVGGVGTAGSLREVQGLRKHAVTISDVKWSSDSAELLSGGYDQTCKIWDVESGKMVDSYECEGFVQAVSFSPIDRNIMFYGTSRNVLGILDRRKPDAALTIRNDSMVNSLYVFPDAMSVLSADASGCLKTWDVRDGRSCHSFVNEPTKKPISHITVCDDKSDDGPRYLAVNSYDNVLRVYDRGFAPPDSSYRLLHALKGYKNKNWPIKSSFRRIKSSGSHGDIFAKADIPADTIDTIGDSDVLLATGSADPFVYLYQISSHGTSEFLQRLEGHTDRVYATSFHPTEPILASCSADFSVKLWYSGKSKRSS